MIPRIQRVLFTVVIHIIIWAVCGTNMRVANRASRAACNCSKVADSHIGTVADDDDDVVREGVDDAGSALVVGACCAAVVRRVRLNDVGAALADSPSSSPPVALASTSATTFGAGPYFFLSLRASSIAAWPIQSEDDDDRFVSSC